MATDSKIDRRVDVKGNRSCFLLRVFIYLLTFAWNWLFNSTLFPDLLFFNIIPSEVSWVQLIARFKRQLLQNIYPSIHHVYLTKQSALPSAFYAVSWERVRLSCVSRLRGAILWDYTVSVFKWNLETIWSNPSEEAESKKDKADYQVPAASKPCSPFFLICSLSLHRFALGSQAELFGKLAIPVHLDSPDLLGTPSRALLQCLMCSGSAKELTSGLEEGGVTSELPAVTRH